MLRSRPTRRLLLAAAAAAFAGASRAQDRRFLGYTQAELDRAYDQRAWSAQIEAVVARYAADSAAVRAKYSPRTERYGPHEAEMLDVFAPPGASGLPVMVFLHGGAWLRLTKEDASAPAPTFLDRGAIYIAPNFANVAAVGLPGMAEQVTRAVEWVARNAAALGADPARIHLSGHSSGAHLAAVVLTADWAARGLPGVVRGGLLMSGIYDLHPPLLSSRSGYMRGSEAIATALSPMRHLNRLACPVTLAWGDHESPEFFRQSEVFAAALAGMGRLSAQYLLPGTDHFEVPLQLQDPASTLSQATFRIMGLA